MTHRAGARVRIRFRTWLAVVLGMWASFAFGQPDTEPQLEAAYLVNFMKYVEWPASYRTTNTICLFGRDSLGTYLAAYEGRQVGGRELLVRRVSKPDDMAGCQLVYIPELEEARTGAVLRWVENMTVLTVSNQEGFARLGGGIELIRNGGRIQFIVNMAPFSRSGLVPSSQMLRLAQRVIGVER